MPKHKSMPSIVPTKMLYVLSVLVYIVLLQLVPDQKYSNKEYVLTEAFVPRCHYQPSRSAAITTSPSTSAYGKKKRKTVSSSSLLWYAESPEDSLLSKMKSPDMKKELESYGISTKSMFDKKEFETALKEARRKGDLEDKRKTKVTTTNTSSTTTNKKHFKQEVATSSDSSAEKGKNKNKTREKKKSSIWKGIASAAKEVLDSNAKKFSDSVSSSTKEKSSSFSAATSNNSKNNTRQQRYEVALKEGAAMKISKLKNELTDRGISTVSYFEKSDLIDAYANAIADNSVSNDKTSPTNKGTTNTDRRSSNDSIFDPSYKNVIMSSFDLRTMILPGEVVIDITAA